MSLRITERIDDAGDGARWLSLWLAGRGFVVESVSHIAAGEDLDARRAHALAEAGRMAETEAGKVRARSAAL